MRNRLTVTTVFALAAWLCAARPALAQYKNTAFGLDAGGWMITKPSVVGEDGSPAPIDERPLRLMGGLRLGGETNLKLDADHVWFTGRVNVAFLSFPPGRAQGSIDDQFDYNAKRALGTIFAVQGSMGLRYVFLTDRFRPYVQGALSYLRLMSFKSQAEQDCVDMFYCMAGETYEYEYMPHPNVGGLHLQPGVELLWARDVGLHLFVDLQHWLIYNAPDNNAVVLGLGFVFFT